MVTLRIPGPNRFTRIEREAPAKFHKTMLKGAGYTANLAKQIAPVDTGFMREQIQVEDRGVGNGVILRAAALYSGYVEYGTSRMEAQPFMRPAVQSMKKVIASWLRKIKL